MSSRLSKRCTIISKSETMQNTSNGFYNFRGRDFKTPPASFVAPHTGMRWLSVAFLLLPRKHRGRAATKPSLAIIRMGNILTVAHGYISQRVFITNTTGYILVELFYACVHIALQVDADGAAGFLLGSHRSDHPRTPHTANHTQRRGGFRHCPRAPRAAYWHCIVMHRHIDESPPNRHCILCKARKALKIKDFRKRELPKNDYFV